MAERDGEGPGAGELLRQWVHGTDKRLLLASHNQGKIAEMRELVAPLGAVIVTAPELGLREPEEDGDSFGANALLKARHAARHGGIPALADDSGLEVEALGGRPGIHSARWAGDDRDFSAAIARIRVELAKSGFPEPFGAAFCCALGLVWPNGTGQVFHGRIEGALVWPPRGSRGFGYDPVFRPCGSEQTFGEMEPAYKHAISHRAIAFRALMELAGV